MVLYVGTRLEQEDTFFPAQNGRLKVHVEGGGGLPVQCQTCARIYIVYIVYILKAINSFSCKSSILILLQLRIEKGSHGQLIFYNRNDTAGPKLSDYTKTIVQVSHHKIYTTIGNISIVCLFFTEPRGSQKYTFSCPGSERYKSSFASLLCVYWFYNRWLPSCSLAHYHVRLCTCKKIIIIHYRPLYWLIGATVP